MANLPAPAFERQNELAAGTGPLLVVLVGGHNVPEDKIAARYDRMRKNVKAAVSFVDFAIIVDNSSLDFLNASARTATSASKPRNGMPTPGTPSTSF